MRGIVTGASRGLGLALTRALVERGCRSAVDARDGDALAAAWPDAPPDVLIPGDVADTEHRRALVDAAGEPIDLLVNNASLLGPSPLSPLASYPLDELRRVYEANVLAPLALVQFALPRFSEGARLVNVTSDAAFEAYETWGGYGSSKAALAQITSVLAVEHPELRAYGVDPGDMRTQMQQDAFPGEDISDRPPPEECIPGLLALIEGDLPSGSYRARDLLAVSACPPSPSSFLPASRPSVRPRHATTSVCSSVTVRTTASCTAAFGSSRASSLPAISSSSTPPRRFLPRSPPNGPTARRSTSGSRRRPAVSMPSTGSSSCAAAMPRSPVPRSARS